MMRTPGAFVLANDIRVPRAVAFDDDYLLSIFSGCQDGVDDLCGVAASLKTGRTMDSFSRLARRLSRDARTQRHDCLPAPAAQVGDGCGAQILATPERVRGAPVRIRSLCHRERILGLEHRPKRAMRGIDFQC